MATRVRDLMTSDVEVLHVGDDLASAAEIMKRARIRHLPVVDGDGHLVGLVTHRMILGAWVSHGHPGSERPGEVAAEVPVEMLMEREVSTLSPEMPAAAAAGILRMHKFGCLPVLEDGVLVGIVTEADFVKFAEAYFENEAANEPDA